MGENVAIPSLTAGSRRCSLLFLKSVGNHKPLGVIFYSLHFSILLNCLASFGVTQYLDY